MYKDFVDQFKAEHTGYINDVENFFDYLREKKRYDRPFTQDVLGSVRKETIRDSIKWQTEDLHNFKSRATARKYMSAVVTLFRWLLKESDLTNEAFRYEYRLEREDSNSYWYCCKKYIRSCRLLVDPATQDALEADKVESILMECNTAIEDYSDLETRNERIAFNNMVSALIVKTILLTGVQYRTLRNIPYADYHRATETLCINGKNITIPFTQQFDQYVDALGDTELEYLFEFREMGDGHEVVQLDDAWANTPLLSFFKRYLEIGAIKVIAKVGIQQLLKRKVPETLIRDMTGAGNTIMDACFKEAFPRSNNSEVITSALKRTEFYSLF